MQYALITDSDMLVLLDPEQLHHHPTCSQAMHCNHGVYMQLQNLCQKGGQKPKMDSNELTTGTPKQRRCNGKDRRHRVFLDDTYSLI